MKITKLISIYSIFYLVVFFIDWIATLFTLGDTNEIVESFLGVRIEQTADTNTLFLQTSLLPRAVIMYLAFLLIIVLAYYLIIRLKTNRK